MSKGLSTAEEILNWAEIATSAGPMALDRRTAEFLAECVRLRDMFEHLDLTTVAGVLSWAHRVVIEALPCGEDIDMAGRIAENERLRQAFDERIKDKGELLPGVYLGAVFLRDAMKGGAK